ncbi:hypothetical protein LNP04_14120 [Chryseobacterium sp. C-71]|uniref:hypothetical protein n=1 Tax=Chryseobacterium sp. C-71 TaxID=2893882 RepID=UPI001E2E6CE9|nr:hypothetical protein [Chryseobacterium sp. C-71]UFH31104.1 hypothetical protein LNP04_14120 [Chryseobacterium sp. C-71]
MDKEILRIDLLSDWQKYFAFGLGEVVLREKNSHNNVVIELLLATNAFDLIMDLNNDYLNQIPESTIYKYNYSRDFKENAWASGKEELIVDIEDFYFYLKSNKSNVDENLFGKEYNEVIKICESVIKNENSLYLIADDY